MEPFQFHTVDEDGNPLTIDRLFIAWVQLAGTLAQNMPDGHCRRLCEAVYQAVKADEETHGMATNLRD